ncbi:MAG: hypothetical protein M1421_04635 [Candidatus Eremiobacteraeota bacterium]|nr:hypothetical protein [Candidatus Eremiobacteraeota bacterium]
MGLSKEKDKGGISMAVPNPQDLPERVSRLEILFEFIHQKLNSLENWITMIHEEMKEGFTQLHQEMNAKFDQTHLEMTAKFDQTHQEIKDGLDKARQERDALRQEMNAKFEKLEDKIDRKFQVLEKKFDFWQKWTLGAGFAAWVTIVLGILGIFFRR